MKWDQRIGRRLKLHDLHVFIAVAELSSMRKQLSVWRYPSHRFRKRLLTSKTF